MTRKSRPRLRPCAGLQGPETGWTEHPFLPSGGDRASLLHQETVKTWDLLSSPRIIKPTRRPHLALPSLTGPRSTALLQPGYPHCAGQLPLSNFKVTSASSSLW